MNFRVFLVASGALFAGLGCNPQGTCVSEKEVESLGAPCTINHSKNGCEQEDSTQFFAEAGSAGVLRCKLLGYGDVPGTARPTDSKALYTFYKKSASGAPKK